VISQRHGRVPVLVIAECIENKGRFLPNGRSIWVGKGSHRVHVEVAADGADVEIRQEEIDEDVHSRHLPVRLGIDLTEPVTQARTVMAIRPATK
jgi:hypothetical protein